MNPDVLSLWWFAHADRLFIAALKLANGDGAAAEDLRAETFLQALTSEFRELCRPYTYLFRIMLNIFLQQKRRRASVHVADLHAFVDVRAPDPLALVLLAERAAHVRAEVSRLSPKRRQAVAVLFGEVKNGVGANALKVRLFQARRILRERLAVVAP